MTQNKKYFKVIAKCGHVGRGNYVPISFAVIAESAKAASQKVMTYHRVKKHLKDAIISCEEIDIDSYKELKYANVTNPYLFCKCKRQQKEIANFDKTIMKNTIKVKGTKIEPEKSLKYRKTIYELGGKRSNLCVCCCEE